MSIFDGNMGLFDTDKDRKAREGFIYGIKNGMTREYLDTLDNQYRAKYGRGIPGEVYDRLKEDRGFADKFNQFLQIPTAELLKTTDLDTKNNLISWGMITNADWVKTQQDMATAADEEANKKPEYVYEPPEQFKTIEEQANETVKAGSPEFNPQLVTDWENKLETSYKPVREKLKTNMANYWASLFPQGGGSGTQAVDNMGQLNDFEMNKFNTATGFAQNDLQNKINAFNLAKNQLFDIGNTEVTAKQKGAEFDMAGWLANLNDRWNRDKLSLETANQQDLYNKNESLAKYLADIQKPQQPDFLQSITSPLVQGGSAALMAYLLSSKDFKDEIINNKIDSVELIKSLDIKNYKYKGEDKQRIGIIAEDTPDLLTDEDKKHLDVVNLFGVLLDAIKQLTLRLEKMEIKNG